jgi:hypothetical protein
LSISLFLGAQQQQFLTWPGQAQRQVFADFPYAGTIKIIGDENLKVVEAVYQTEGEYARALQLHSTVSEGVLFLKEQEMPDFQSPNDKLGAHKVFATSITLKIPATQSLRLVVNDARLSLEGHLIEIDVVQQGGQCLLKNWSGPGKIQTQDAEIVLDVNDLTLQISSPANLQANCPLTQEGPFLQIGSQRGAIRCVAQ